MAANADFSFSLIVANKAVKAHLQLVFRVYYDS